MARMHNKHGVFVGWVEISIRDVVHQHSDLLHAIEFSLLTVIDSSDRLSGLVTAQRMVKEIEEAEFCEDALMIPTNKLAQADRRYNLFNGFDEVCFFDSKPTRAKPEDIVTVAPIRLDLEGIPESSAHWIKRANCELLLGDGIGMNFVTPNEKLATRLVDHRLPRP